MHDSGALHQTEPASRPPSQFFLAISHDLRTPLNGIIGLSDVLLRDPQMPTNFHKTLSAIRSSGQRFREIQAKP